MPFLKEQDKRTLQSRLKTDLKEDITIKLFTVRSAGLLIVPGRECPTCPQANELVNEVASLSPRIKVETYDFYSQAQAARDNGVDRVPCLVMSSASHKTSNMKLYGVPSGYEFVTLLEGIVALSRNVNPLQPLTRKALKKLDKPVHVQVFVTPT
ncbi:MAG: hypothetical protein FJ315_04050 [SAR202 cluster bacterium]|nr:hypothetical protein [SAR202 cluster bacterium]